MKHLPKIFSPIHLRILLLICADSLTSASVFFLTLLGYQVLGAGQYQLGNYRVFLFFLPIFWVINSCFRCYHGSFFYPGVSLNKIEEIRRLSFSVFLTYLLIFAWLMFSRSNGNYSRFVLVCSMFCTFPLLSLTRFAIRLVMKHLNVGQMNILIAGANKIGQLVCQELDSSCYYGFRIAGFIDDDPDPKTAEFSGHDILGTFKDSEKIAREYNIEYIICCLSPEKMNQTFKSYSKFFSYIMYVPDHRILPISWMYPASIGLFGGFEIRNQLLQKIPRLIKSILEAMLALAAIICLLPIFVILVIAVKLSSPGPVFYISKRLGQNGRTINLVKFRTMYRDADSRLKELLQNNPSLKKEWEANFKLQNDPRITPIGKFLRKTSLDELPQFWNVLTGEMAVIGPRPIIPAEVKYYGQSYELRKRVKPGITGLWQVSGRNETDYHQRIMLDVYYIVNWSIWMDYYIFFKTIYVIILQRGAC